MRTPSDNSVLLRSAPINKKKQKKRKESLALEEKKKDKGTQCRHARVRACRLGTSPIPPPIYCGGFPNINPSLSLTFWLFSIFAWLGKRQKAAYKFFPRVFLRDPSFFFFFLFFLFLITRAQASLFFSFNLSEAIPLLNFFLSLLKQGEEKKENKK